MGRGLEAPHRVVAPWGRGFVLGPGALQAMVQFPVFLGSQPTGREPHAGVPVPQVLLGLCKCQVGIFPISGPKGTREIIRALSRLFSAC